MSDEDLPWFQRDLRSLLPRWLPAWLFASLLFGAVAALIAGLGFDYDERADQLKAIALALGGAFAFSIILFEGLHYATSRHVDPKRRVPRAPVWISVPVLAAAFMIIPAMAIVDRKVHLGRRPGGLVLEGNYALIYGWVLVVGAFGFMAWYSIRRPRSIQRRIAGLLGFLVVAVGTGIIIHSSR